MVTFGLHLAEMHYIHRAFLQVLEPCLLGCIGGLLGCPFGVGKSLEINGRSPVPLREERFDRKIGWTSDTARLKCRELGIRLHRSQKVRTNECGSDALELRFSIAKIGSKH